MKFYQNLLMGLKKHLLLAHSLTFCQESTKLPWKMGKAISNMRILHLLLYMEWLSFYLRCTNLPRASTSPGLPYNRKKNRPCHSYCLLFKIKCFFFFFFFLFCFFFFLSLAHAFSRHIKSYSTALFLIG